MKPNIRTIIIAIALAASFVCATSAYAQVIVFFQQPPQYKFHIENMWKVTLVNPTQTTYTVSLHGRATETNEGLIVDATSARFVLPPGTKMINPRELVPINIRDANPRYRDVVQNIGGLPTGAYEICLSVINSTDNAVLGEMCVQSQVLNLTQVELLQPEDGALFSSLEAWNKSSSYEEESSEAQFKRQMNKIGESTKIDTMETGSTNEMRMESQMNEGNRNGSIPYVGGILAFSWLSPVPLAPGAHVSYTLYIAEIFGGQSPYDAIHSNPNAIVMEKIPTTMVQLPLAARHLPGGNYAWAVKFFLDGILMQESEVHSFTIEDIQPTHNQGDFSRGSRTEVKYYPESNNYQGYSLPKFSAGFNLPVINGNSIQRSGFGMMIPQMFSSFFSGSEFQGAETMGGSDGKTSVIPIALTGNARMEYHDASRMSSFSEIPEKYFNADLNPGIKLYGLPFSANILYSTNQNPNQQNINSFNLNFDFESMRQGLALRLQNAVAEIESAKSLKADDINKIRSLSPAELDSAKALNTDELSNLRNSSEAEIEMAKSLKAEKLNKIRNLTPDELESAKSFNADELSNLRNPKNLTDNLQRYASITGPEKLFMSIRSLGIGTNYPSYSEYTLSGVPVTGVNIEINPGIFYAAFTGSTNQRGIDSTSYSRNLYAGRIGLGKKEGTHLYFTGLYAKDDEGSIKLDSANYTLTPKSNYVFGTEAKLNLFSDKLTLEGEGALAVLTRDTRDPELESKSIPDWLKKLVDPRISTSFDYSYSGKLMFNNDASATRLSLGIKMVGPGYTSLGVPNLRTDQFGYEAKLDQRFFERRVSVGTFFNRYNDNLIKWKQSTTTTTACGVNLGFNFPRIPFLRLSYSPYFQKNDDLNPLSKVDNTTSVYSVMTGYSYRLCNLNSSTSVTFFGQETKTASGISDCRTNSFMVTDAVSLNIPLSFTASWGLIQSSYGLGDSRINNIDLGANAQVTDGWSIMAGVNSAAEEDRNRKTGFYVSSSISPFKGIGIDLRAEQNVYSEQQVAFGDYHEFLFSANLKAQW
jgi:hypothetical protein